MIVLVVNVMKCSVVLGMILKSGVKVAGVRPEAVIGMVLADGVSRREFGAEAVVTSVVDGKHMARSKHYLGLAFDLRTRDLTEEQRKRYAASLVKALGNEFDVVLESDHIHVEFDTKGVV